MRMIRLRQVVMTPVVAVTVACGLAASAGVAVTASAASAAVTTGGPTVTVAKAVVRGNARQWFDARITVTGLAEPTSFSVSVTLMAQDTGGTAEAVRTSATTLHSGTQRVRIWVAGLRRADRGTRSSLSVALEGAAGSTAARGTAPLEIFRRPSIRITSMGHRYADGPIHREDNGFLGGTAKRLNGRTLVVKAQRGRRGAWHVLGRTTVHRGAWGFDLKRTTPAAVRVVFHGGDHLLPARADA